MKGAKPDGSRALGKVGTDVAKLLKPRKGGGWRWEEDTGQEVCAVKRNRGCRPGPGEAASSRSRKEELTEQRRRVARGAGQVLLLRRNAVAVSDVRGRAS